PHSHLHPLPTRRSSDLEAKAQKQVNELSAAVEGQDKVITEQTAVAASAADDVQALVDAKVTSGAKYDAAVAKLNAANAAVAAATDRKSTRLNSSHVSIS